MSTVFGSLWTDIGFAALFGAIGGFGLGLLQEKGLELPHLHREHSVKFADLGIIGDALIGVLAGVIIYAINQPVGLLKMVATTLPAGIGGSAILKSYVKGTEATKKTSLAKQSQQIAQVAIGALENYQKTTTTRVKGVDVPTLSAQLEKVQAAI